MEDNNESWKAYFSLPTPPRPCLTKIIMDLKKRQLERPTFVCLQYTKESRIQQAMASHCKLHVRAGMAKGNVEHVKYNPDHTYTFLCVDPNPRQRTLSPADPVLPQAPNQINKKVPFPGCTRHVFPFAGPLISDIARSPFLRSDGDLVVHQNNLSRSQGTIHRCNQTQIDSIPSGSSIWQNPNGVTQDIDLNLRLGPTPSAIADDSTTPGTSS